MNNNTGEDYKRYSPYRDLLGYRTLDSIIQSMKEAFPEKKPNDVTVLDVGCGIGGIALPLEYIGYDLVGIDVHAETITEVKNNSQSGRAQYLQMDGTQFDLKRTFDVVLCIGVLEHVKDYEKMLLNLRHHLHNESVGIINIPNGYSIYETLFSRIAPRMNLDTILHRLPRNLYTRLTGSSTPRHSRNVFNRHVHFFSYKQFRHILKRYGFHVLYTVNLGLGIFLDWRIMQPLKVIECCLANYLPPSVAGSWNVVVQKAID